MSNLDYPDRWSARGEWLAREEIRALTDAGKRAYARHLLALSAANFWWDRYAEFTAEYVPYPSAEYVAHEEYLYARATAASASYEDACAVLAAFE